MKFNLFLCSTCLLGVIGCQCLFVENKIGEMSKPSADLELLVDDGVWCWFSDPRAIYYRGEKEKFYFGFVNTKGDVLIGSKDVRSGEIETYILHDTLEIDDHNVPSILILPNGQLLAFYNEHNGHVFMRKSKSPEDISAWEEEQIISEKTEDYSYTYTNPVRLSEENGRIYLIGRKVGPTRSFEHWWQYLKYSDDNAQTWSEELILLDNEGRKNPPYLKVTTDHRSRIDFLFTDGHPKIGADVSVFHMYYQDNSFYQTNGSQIASLDQLPIPIRTVDKVYDASLSQVRAWIWDIALKEGNPVITYARFPSEHDHIYHYAWWDGSTWVDQEIVNSGSWMASLRQGDLVREAHYSGGIVLDHQDPTQIYLSRDVSGKFEIEHRRLFPDGRWETTPITENSREHNVRPYVVLNCPEDQPILLWMSGVYRHYTEYQMGIRLARR